MNAPPLLIPVNPKNISTLLIQRNGRPERFLFISEPLRRALKGVR